MIHYPPGYVKYHCYITEQAEVQAIIEQLQKIKVIEVTPEEFAAAAATSDEIITIRIYSGRYELVIASHYGYFVRNESEYWRFEDFPEFSYDNAVRSFIVSNPAAEIYEGDTHLGTYTDLIGEIEFVVGSEEHDHTTDTRRWTLICEFGELIVYDETHFWYNGQNYVITGERSFGFAQLPQ